MSAKIEKLEKYYLTEKEVIRKLGFKEDTFTTKKLQQKITGIIALCDSENIKYKYYEKGFNKGYKKTFLYVNKAQLLHF
ncbi:hypothetical protein [Bacillus cereus]|uniref:hypothetical protein n=1 Tax=Bacillus cereus TaxID=1396 RepID=UPI001F395926|nr:hypothetical protein [Bacillus cereus]BCC93279.1 hypothetical protein BC30043_1708 [Bacillus cereus]